MARAKMTLPGPARRGGRCAIGAIKIICKCGKDHEVPAAIIGKKIRCMACQKVIRVKTPRVGGEVKPANHDGLQVSGTRECPGCKEVFFIDQTKICVTCGINLLTGGELYQASENSASWSSVDAHGADAGFIRGLIGRLLGRR